MGRIPPTTAVSLGLQETPFVAWESFRGKLWVLGFHLEAKAHRKDLGFIWFHMTATVNTKGSPGKD